MSENLHQDLGSCDPAASLNLPRLPETVLDTKIGQHLACGQAQENPAQHMAEGRRDNLLHGGPSESVLNLKESPPGNKGKRARPASFNSPYGGQNQIQNPGQARTTPASQGKAKKPKEDPPIKVTVTYIREHYKLTDFDLIHLDCETKDNPHWAGGPPMRLYIEDEVKAVYQEKQIHLAYIEKHAAENKAKKLAQQKQEAQELKARCESQIGKFSDSTLTGAVIPKTESGLPIEVWEKVLGKLPDDIEHEGIRGVSVIARDICNAAAACKDMRLASSSAFERLAEKTNVEVENESKYQEFLQNPAQYNAPELKSLTRARALEMKGIFDIDRSKLLKVSCPKPVLIMHLLQSFGVTQPSQIPAKILEAVQQEKNLGSFFEAKIEGRMELYRMKLPGVHTVQSDFNVRKTATDNGWGTLSELKKAVETKGAAKDPGFELQMREIQFFGRLGRADRLQDKE